MWSWGAERNLQTLPCSNKPNQQDIKKNRMEKEKFYEKAIGYGIRTDGDSCLDGL